MKKFLKEYGPGLVNVAVMFVSLILALSSEPSAAIKGEGGWLLVRGITLVWSVIIAIGSYSKWVFFGKAVKELISSIKGAKKDLDAGWKHSYFQKFSLGMWVAVWILFWQIMASFYVADWCQGGF